MKRVWFAYFFINAVGQEFLFNLIGPNEAFGLPLLEDDQFRVTGAAAHQPSIVLSIAREDFLQLMDHSPQFMRNIYLELITSARKLLLHIRSLVTLSLNGRLATMNQLQQFGLIRVEGQKIVVLDRPGLEKMTEEQTLKQV